MANLLFYYFGDDEAYFKTLQSEFKRHTRLAIDFKKIYESDESKIQSLFIKIFKNHPACVFLDFSKNTQDYLHLARLISRTPLEHKIVMVGLVDYLSPPELMIESNSTGVNLTHIKSAETYDVIFDVARLISPQEMSEHGFAMAQLKNENLEVGIPCKVGYIHESGIHIETDHPLKKGDRHRINHFWLNRKLIPSKEVVVSATSQSNLFYQFKQSADLDFQFMDEFIPAEGMDGQTIKEKNDERTENIRHAKKQLEKWIVDNETRSESKKAKVLIVDRDFHFFQNQARTDKHPYVIRCIPFFNDLEEELNRLRPQVIAFSMDKDGPTARNSLQMLSKLSELLKTKFKDLHTFLIVFNTKTPSKQLQDDLQFPQSMASDAEVSVDVLVRMADVFEKKLAKLKVIGEPEGGKVFLKKSNSSSLCEILLSINVKKMSETDLIFTSDHNFPIGTNLHLSSPVDMYINVQPTKNNGEFHGLIHCLGEVQKKDLRRYVNSVFFRDHDAQIQAEGDEFKKLNEAKLIEKNEAIKKENEALAESEKPEEKVSTTDTKDTNLAPIEPKKTG